MIVRLLSATLFPYTTLFRSPSDVAPENWHGPAQPSAHAHMPTKNTAAAHGGTAALMYSEIAMSGSPSPGTTLAAAMPTTTPRMISGAPITAARNRPRWPSSGVRADIDIWNAACASGTLTMKVPNHATMSDTPALAGAVICGFASAYSRSPSMPGDASSAHTPTTNIAPMTTTFIV